MQITEDFISRFMGNASALANGRELAASGQFTALCVSEDGGLIFGACQGSGKNPYQCSVDFADPEKPVPRCSCPSRQIPCKHVAGLLFCKAKGKAFETAALPEDVLAKRAKIQKRQEKKTEAPKEKSGPPLMTKARATAAAKKCRAQLEGIGLAEKILHNVVLTGLNAIDRENARHYAEQVKALGNHYIGGIQAAFLDLLIAVENARGAQDFSAAIEQLNTLYALLKKSRAHTENKIADFDAFPETPERAKEAMLHSDIEERIGHAWKLSELAEKGLRLENARLIQLGFDVYEDEARQQFVDEGIWLCLDNGAIVRTQNLRPFKAQKHLRAEDSFFGRLFTSELFIYPGERNPRVRWEGSQAEEIAPEDFVRARDSGADDFAEVVKAVKAQIRQPLADRNPIVALKIATMETDAAGGLYLRDGKGMKIPLRLDQFGILLKKASRAQVEGGGTLVCRFDPDPKTDILWGVPVALLTGEAVIRFTY